MKVKRRLDYTPPPFTISSVELNIKLHPTHTRVESTLTVSRQGVHNEPLWLDGEGLNLVSVKVDDSDITAQVQVSETGMSVPCTQDTFKLHIVNHISPSTNKALEGLYQAGNAYCTQCEAEGFRRITYFTDRPDVLAVYTVTLSAPEEGYPFLLANGNKVNERTENGERIATWHDPFPKPSYLFAIVAGDFDVVEDNYVTASGRDVKLAVYVDKGYASRATFALQALQRAMRWDEENYGREYDLDVYMIVAVDFFNMGAMENKGLNVFNSKYILADNATATDKDFFNVEAVVAHEYFHNWTGNRVTCRDWFQLSLKEGLTVFRDQQFSADMSSPLSTRLSQINIMREHQFAEDASAMSHPIRPDEVIEMNNFYTVTVYDKGAEVIRMLHAILGKERFRQGMDTYFERHDGKAVTCDDFVDAMQSATTTDLSHFRRWYSQSGTPVLSVGKVVNSESGEVTISLSQHTKPTAGQPDKHPLTLPLRIACYTSTGKVLALSKASEGIKVLSDDLIMFESECAELTFNSHDINPPTEPVVFTALGDFSAPVKVEQSFSVSERSIVAMADPDPFNRWDALQSLYNEGVLRCQAGESANLNDLFSVVKEVITLHSHDAHLLAELLSVPSVESLIQQQDDVDPIKLSQARAEFCRCLAISLNAELTAMLQAPSASTYAYEQEQVGERKLRHALLMLLSYLPDTNAFIEKLYQVSDNMTDTLTALNAAQRCNSQTFIALMHDFEQKWHGDSLVLDKWFGLHATQPSRDILSTLTLLKQHPKFADDNPNRVRALIGSFAFYNTEGFHAKDGSGYKYVTDYLMELDKVNPQVAARIVTPLIQWQKFDQAHQQLMKTQLSRLLNEPGLSKDLFEKVSKSLAYEQAS
ncbi:aminopeptidase N [Alteromonas sediminis]|uniref:Aminopeptidase N n=1 Tax=Alteromonas sediminis TaxID=2259342 RepID=A0A3N5Y3F8_9ALTE|nr:aminopeptidase N [Alteromonas sediminis]RPJ67336.1 aminopeptidase N [Alteromonas sediminis]